MPLPSPKRLRAGRQMQVEPAKPLFAKGAREPFTRRSGRQSFVENGFKPFPTTLQMHFSTAR